MSNSLFLAPLLFQHDLMVLFPHILHVCLHLNQSDPETQPAYAAERSSFANCNQCSSTSYVPLSQILYMVVHANYQGHLTHR